ncbi:long-chain acyl-CoA synthetase [Crossiella equi]|uniref:Long-chain acyl-CoA synthetase n=1 Tax=Crossiella equi TaxID=130796 RepID=A0ABS5A5P3_9PSEU|nr:class I adenylate-forming enzyme family protein [Crossiella equi]MBP2471920.1 long-chain acyl-CoA synthetase [Crossiella equi]
MNIADFLHRADPNSTAVHAGEASWEYGRLLDESGRLAAALLRSGLTVGDRVGILLPNTPAHILAYLAVTSAGGVVVSLNPTLSGAEVRDAFGLTEPRLVVTEPELVPAVRAATSAEVVTDRPTEGARSIPELLAENPRAAAVVPVGADHPASILFTSGSTGRPKGVVLTHGNAVWAAEAKASRMRPVPGDRVALISPLHHAYGQNAVLNAALSGGAAVVLLDPRRRRKLVADLAAAGVSVLPTVPALLRVLLDLGASRETLPALRYTLSAAAPLSRPIAELWADRFGAPPHVGYGLTECSPCALYQDGPTVAAGSVGRPFPGVDTRVVGADGADVPDGEIGELWLRGPNVMAGYFADPAASAEVLVGGWLRTGDQVRRDASGEHWLAGRSKHIIIVSGVNVFPGEVEAVLAEHPAVRAAAVVGRPHPVVGETVLAFVHLREGVAAEDAVPDLRARCRDRLAPVKRPALIQALPEIPLLASGKPDLERLRRWGVR